MTNDVRARCDEIDHFALRAARDAARVAVRLAGIAALAFSAAALAQPDCSAVPEQYRARCEQAAKVRAACAGLEGEAKKSCEMRNYNYKAATENCGSLAGEAKLECEQHNRTMGVAAVCKGKEGAEAVACIKAQAALHAQ